MKMAKTLFWCIKKRTKKLILVRCVVFMIFIPLYIP